MKHIISLESTVNSVCCKLQSSLLSSRCPPGESTFVYIFMRIKFTFTFTLPKNNMHLTMQSNVVFVYRLRICHKYKNKFDIMFMYYT